MESSPYNFGFDNPITYSDPTGLYSENKEKDRISLDPNEFGSFLNTFKNGGNIDSMFNEITSNNTNYHYNGILLEGVTMFGNSIGNWQIAGLTGHSQQDAYATEHNFQDSQSMLNDAVSNTKVGQSVSATEGFLFTDIPLFLSGAGEIKWGAVAIKGGISFAAQWIVNGNLSDVNALGVVSDAFLAPGYSGYFGTKYRLTSEQGFEINHDNKQLLINSSSSLFFDKLGGGLSPLIKHLPASEVFGASRDLILSTLTETINRGYEENQRKKGK